MASFSQNNKVNNNNIWFDERDLRNYNRAQVTCMRSGLSDDEQSLIPNIFNAQDLNEMLRATNSYLNSYNRQTFRCSYNTKFFLEALATSIEADLSGV